MLHLRESFLPSSFLLLLIAKELTLCNYGYKRKVLSFDFIKEVIRYNKGEMYLLSQAAWWLMKPVLGKKKSELLEMAHFHLHLSHFI